MAPPKPRTSCSAMSSSEESSVVQVLDSCEPLVTSSSSDSVSVQVIDSCEPLVPSFSSPQVQVLDSSEPLVPGNPPPEPVAGPSGAGPSRVRFENDEIAGPGSPTSSVDNTTDEEPVQASVSGSSGRRVHMYAEEIRSRWNTNKFVKKLDTPKQCIEFAVERKLLPREKFCTVHKKHCLLACPWDSWVFIDAEKATAGRRP